MMNDMVPDEILAARWREGDGAAGNALGRRYLPKLWAVARHWAGIGDADVAEVIQVTLGKALKDLADWDPEHGGLMTWLCGILKNERANHFRRRNAELRKHRDYWMRSRARRPPAPDFLSPCDQHSPRLHDPVTLERLREILDGFPSDRLRWLIRAPGHLDDAWRKRLSRERSRIAGLLHIRATGPRLSYLVAKQLFMASLCGKLPKELSE